MRELKCPECGAVLTVDEADNTPVLDRVKNDAFDAGVSKRLTELYKQQKIEQTTILLQSEQRLKDSDMEYIFIMFEMKNETDMTTPSIRIRISLLGRTKTVPTRGVNMLYL